MLMPMPPFDVLHSAGTGMGGWWGAVGGLGSHCISEDPFHRHGALMWRSIGVSFYPREVAWLRAGGRNVKGQAAGLQ